MSNRLVKTPDTALIFTVTNDGYGDPLAQTSNEVKCAFFQSFRTDNVNNEELTQSDAYAYIDINNAFVKNLGYQLQGMYFKFDYMSIPQWYTITSVEIAQRKLLTNEVNNVLVNLQVSKPPLGA